MKIYKFVQCVPCAIDQIECRLGGALHSSLGTLTEGGLGKFYNYFMTS